MQSAVFGTNWRMARRLIKEQQRKWFAAGKSADDIFIMLKLNKRESNIFANPLLITWYNYVVVTNRHGANTEMASVLLKYYDDATLFKIFKTTEPHYQTMLYVVKLETAVRKLLNLKILRALECFKALDLHLEVDDLLNSPNLKDFLDYLKNLNEEMPGRPVTQIGIYTHFFGEQALARMLETAKKVEKTEKIATIYQTAQLKKWFHDGKTQKEVSEMFNLMTNTNPDAEIRRLYKSYCMLHYKKS